MMCCTDWVVTQVDIDTFHLFRTASLSPQTSLSASTRHSTGVREHWSGVVRVCTCEGGDFTPGATYESPNNTIIMK